MIRNTKIIILIGAVMAITVILLLAESKGPVVPIGSYSNKHNHQKVIINTININPDATFSYQYSFYDGSVSTKYIKGTYEITGKKLRLFVKEFNSSSSPLIARTEKIVIKNRPKGGVISETIHPERFKKLLANFEARGSQLKPVYFFKRVKGKLSLCLKDVKSGRYVVEFKKKEN